MDIWRVRGGNRLEGTCSVQGSKNASLPILAACAAVPVRAELSNVPDILDVDSALGILRLLGCRTAKTGRDVYIDSTAASQFEIPTALMLRMRSSVFFMGALLARFGQARLSLPGGCPLGKRPVDIHIDALRRLGAEIEENGEELICRAERLKGAEIFLPYPSVGATENIMLASIRAEGKTVIHGAAREPEIVSLQSFLRLLGCSICGAGSDTIIIGECSQEGYVSFRMIPDRIEAATLACAAACCGGKITLRDMNPEHISSVLHFLNAAGCDIITNNSSITLESDARLGAVEPICTQPYPGFPTDAQPLLMAALLKAAGETKIEETVFENRFRQVAELRKLGADISLTGQCAHIRGVEKLEGCRMYATDLRGGASMIIAALSAEGESLVMDAHHVRRGYDGLEKKLRMLGAEIELLEG